MDELTPNYGLNRLGQGHPNHAYTEDMDTLDGALDGHDLELEDHEVWLLGHDDDIAALETDLGNHKADDSAHHTRYSDGEATTAVETTALTITPEWEFDNGLVAPNASGSDGGLFIGSDPDNHLSVHEDRYTFYSGEPNGWGWRTGSSQGGYTWQLRLDHDGTLTAEGPAFEEGTDRLASRDWVEANTGTSDFSGSHNDLTDVDPGDHHTRYSDDEARTAVDNSNVSVAHADDADNATSADHATSADSATTADSAGHADTADNATNSTFWDGYELQKNGTGGTGVINFET